MTTGWPVETEVEGLDVAVKEGPDTFIRPRELYPQGDDSLVEVKKRHHPVILAFLFLLKTSQSGSLWRLTAINFIYDLRNFWILRFQR